MALQTVYRLSSPHVDNLPAKEGGHAAGLTLHGRSGAKGNAWPWGSRSGNWCWVNESARPPQGFTGDTKAPVTQASHLLVVHQHEKNPKG